MTDDWMGAKLALFVGDELAVLHRDDKPGLLWAGAWDLPGGGREGRETPLACALRETHEELSIVVDPNDVQWGKRYLNSIGRVVWFFACHVDATRAAELHLGAEGQRWSLMTPGIYLSSTCVVLPFKDRLRDYLGGSPSDDFTRDGFSAGFT